MRDLVVVLILLSLTTTVFAQSYIIKKVNKGTHFLKAGQQFAGYVDNNKVCGAKEGTALGGEACAVVIAPAKIMPGQQIYSLKEVYITGTPAKNLVGFIKGSIKRSSGIGGNKGIGIFRLKAQE